MKSFKMLVLASVAALGLMAAPAMAGNVNNINLGVGINQGLTAYGSQAASAVAQVGTDWGWVKDIDANALAAAIGNSGSVNVDPLNNGSDQGWQASVTETVSATQMASMSGQSAGSSAATWAPAGAESASAEATSVTLGNSLSAGVAPEFNLKY
jgi:hypothetical protein